jgi:uncharacterized protein (TIGR02145 family)
MKALRYSLVFLVILTFISCVEEDSTSSNTNLSRIRNPINVSEVLIGNQIWMTKNLNVSRYRNGDPIPQVTDRAQWEQLTTGAWCYFVNDSAYGSIYGKLYNWYAVNDPRGLAPIGYHIPSDSEWTTLTNFLGGQAVAGGKMKANSSLWLAPNVGVTASNVFMGLPGGFRTNAGDNDFVAAITSGWWWSSTASESVGFGNFLSLSHSQSNVVRAATFNRSGLSVRCIKD